jgi:hypothetical protein
VAWVLVLAGEELASFAATMVGASPLTPGLICAGSGVPPRLAEPLANGASASRRSPAHSEKIAV